MLGVFNLKKKKGWMLKKSVEEGKVLSQKPFFKSLYILHSGGERDSREKDAFDTCQRYQQLQWQF